MRTRAGALWASGRPLDRHFGAAVGTRQTTYASPTWEFSGCYVVLSTGSQDHRFNGSPRRGYVARSAAVIWLGLILSERSWLAP